MSDRLFGRSCRLPVAAWVALHPKGRFFQSEVPTYGTVSRSNLNQELGRLVELGMLDEERPDDTNKVYYVRTASPLWDVVHAAVGVLHLRWQEKTIDQGYLEP